MLSKTGLLMTAAKAIQVFALCAIKSAIVDTKMFVLSVIVDFIAIVERMT